MSGFGGALRCELLKARRSRVPLWTAAGFSLAPLMAGLFMFILKDPSRARALGLLRAKAQIAAGVHANRIPNISSSEKRPGPESANRTAAVP